MPEGPDNIVLEHLRHIRRVVDRLDVDMTELKSCISGFEGTVGRVMAQIASQTRRIDQIETRLDPIPA